MTLSFLPQSDQFREPLLDRLLTPLDLKQYVPAARNFKVEDSTNELKLAKGNTNGIQRMLRIPLVRPSQLVASDAYYVQVDVGLRAASASNSPMLFLSDNRNAVGFVLPSTLDDTTAVCSGTEGEEIFPNGLTQARILGDTIIGSNQSEPTNGGSNGGNSRRRRQVDSSDDDSDDDSDDSDDSDDDTDDDSDDGNDYSDDYSDDDSDIDSDDSDDDSEDGNRISGVKGGAPPPQPADVPTVLKFPSAHTDSRLPAHATTLLFKPRNSWGSCSATQTAGATNAVMFSLPTNPQNGLFLDIYLGSQEQGIGLKYMLIRLVLETGSVATV